MIPNSSQEDYLKAIYHLEQEMGTNVSTNAIAVRVQTKASSVTDMLKKLAARNYVHYERYYGVELTSAGREMAIDIIRKHRLWESFLVDKLDFSWDEVHEVAEHLEHIRSEKLIAALDRFLGYPKLDPHGHPIPDRNGNFIGIDKTLLSDCQKGTRIRITGVKDPSKPFLKYLDNQNLKVGSIVEICGKEEFDNSLEIKVLNRLLSISDKTASNLYIEITK